MIIPFGFYSLDASEARICFDSDSSKIAFGVMPSCLTLKKADIKKKKRQLQTKLLSCISKTCFCSVLITFESFVFGLKIKAVTVEIKDGRIVAIHPVEMPLPLNTSQIELAILASATSPIASVPQNLTGNGTEAHAVSESN